MPLSCKIQGISVGYGSVIRKMSKALLTRIQELCYEPIFIGTSVADLQREVIENCWGINASQIECAEVTVAEVMTAIEAVLVCRRTQVAVQADVRGALFYMWFDSQTAQLRCGMISDRDAELPFNCETVRISSMEPIISSFLSSPYHEGISWDELAEIEWSDSDGDDGRQCHPLQVYVMQMP